MKFLSFTKDRNLFAAFFICIICGEFIGYAFSHEWEVAGFTALLITAFTFDMLINQVTDMDEDPHG
jgi:1,4-dihydroxy-2-naphthoate octaprenyltransferase